MNRDDMVRVRSVQIETDPSRGNMVILKEDPESDLYVLMFIGDAEFGAIAKEKGMIEPKRPLTHDLYLGIIAQAQVEFLRVEITEMRDDTFYAKVIFRITGEERVVDSRPSDALALALQKNIPVLVQRRLFRRILTKEEIQEFEELFKTVSF